MRSIDTETRGTYRAVLSEPILIMPTMEGTASVDGRIATALPEIVSTTENLPHADARATPADSRSEPPTSEIQLPTSTKQISNGLMVDNPNNRKRRSESVTADTGTPVDCQRQGKAEGPHLSRKQRKKMRLANNT